jgi:hypothetical protein
MTVVTLGTDYKHRPIKTTPRAAAKLKLAESRLGRDLTVIKGGGLPPDDVSGATHTGLGTLDIRSWNIGAWGNPTGRAAINKVVTELRKVGFAAWYRDQEHGGMDPHIHVVDIGNHTNSPAARTQVRDYLDGRNGLVGRGADYHPRVKVNPWGLIKRRVALRRAQRDLDRWIAAHQEKEAS